ncbi:hypothetical protein [Spiroplasma sp. ChiS]|uniref:hypothetical protein n=1 Tax=Spiroplasma sp. ChiS TaxID=2099885 RepID=UPI0013923979|nr:hypothetical protein [Spiroplasma sp. ChiS]
MLGMYLTTAFNFLTAPTPKTMTEGMTGIWTGLTSILALCITLLIISVYYN